MLEHVAQQTQVGWPQILILVVTRILLLALYKARDKLIRVMEVQVWPDDVREDRREESYPVQTVWELRELHGERLKITRADGNGAECLAPPNLMRPRMKRISPFMA
jgi:hypothetical protein